MCACVCCHKLNEQRVNEREKCKKKMTKLQISRVSSLFYRSYCYESFTIFSNYTRIHTMYMCIQLLRITRIRFDRWSLSLRHLNGSSNHNRMIYEKLHAIPFDNYTAVCSLSLSFVQNLPIRNNWNLNLPHGKFLCARSVIKH